MLFIDMDGMAHLSTDDPSAPAHEAPAQFEPDLHSDSHSANAAPEIPMEPVEFPLENLSDSFPPVDIEPSAHDSGQQTIDEVQSSHDSFEMAPTNEIAPDSHSEPVAAAAGDLNMDNFLGFEEEGATHDESHQESAPGVGPGGNDSLDISSYANSEVSTAKDGPLVIKVLISGIDSKEIRQSIREAIEDSRFGWDAQKLMSRINKGQLTIAKLSPVKASILINRLKRLPIKVRWEQNAVTQMEGS